jgi:predicted PurR-regulated permease PerM
MAGLLVLMIWFRLATPLVSALFAYLALAQFARAMGGRKWLSVGLFLVLICCAVYALGYGFKRTIPAIPDIVDSAITTMIQTGKAYNVELPFTDYDSLRHLAVDTVKGETRYLGSFAKLAKSASTETLFVIAGCVVAISLFLDPRLELGGVAPEARQNLYGAFGEAVQERFHRLYRSFVKVMGAQIIISAINTGLTAIFVFAVGMPYAFLIIGVTFVCGLLPVIGNILSNTVSVTIGFTVSPKLALGALVFLVVIHKLEYLLNSQIVGWRIRNPLWLTLLGLVVGERLLGIPGMILGPVVLHYIKQEMGGIPASPPPPEAPVPAPADAAKKV